MLKVLFCGGGSIGHLAPSVSVWNAVKKKQENTRCLFACSGRREDRIFLKSNDIPHFSIHAPKGNSLLFPLLFPLACLESLIVLLWFRPHVIFSKGGYVSVPVCLVGWILRRPIVLHESDRVMGRANRLLLRLASHFCIGTPQKEVADEKIMARLGVPITATGNPIREKLLTGSKDGGKRVTAFSGKRPVLLVIGGSQGAQILNETVHEHMNELLDICDIIHLTGRGKENSLRQHARYFQRESEYNELHNLYALADLILSRAGAGTIAELSALGKATILVPLPDLAHKHQEENAHFLQVANAVVVIRQDVLKEKFVPTVRELMLNEMKRQELGERLRTFSNPESAERIANILFETAKK